MDQPFVLNVADAPAYGPAAGITSVHYDLAAKRLKVDLATEQPRLAQPLCGLRCG